MRRAISLTVAFLFFLIRGPLAFAQTDAEIAKLRELYQKGNKAYQEKKYGDSIEAFAEFLKLLPDGENFTRARAETHYNIACNFSLLKKAKDAVEHFEHALKHGYRGFEAIDKDADLDNVRKLPEFSALITRYKKLEEEELQKSLEKFDFNLKTVDDKPVAKKDFLGKVLIVDIWGTWCPPCKMEIPHFVELMKKREKDGLRIVGLNHERGAPNADAAAKLVKDFIDNNDINYPCALIPLDLLQSIPNFSGFPTTLFFDRQGKIRKLVVGYHDLKDLEDIIEPLLKEKAPNKNPEKSAEKSPDPPRPEEKKG
ncbi:MAG: redoxin domain-containing protein [Planctomycetes bacterium]|nr:redoxin domain-containing protein [Planctomycetota bacterium]